MRLRNCFVVALLAAALAVPATAGTLDACDLLDGRAIVAAQGESPVRFKAHGRSEGEFEVRQCFWTLPTHTNSISLQVTRHPERGKVPARWRALFHEQDNGGKTGAPRPIADLGDDAFWAGNAEISGLYVLSGEDFIRVAVGGGTDEDDRIRRAVALSRTVLERLAGERRTRP